VYCSSSQAVKNRYRYHRPKPGAHRVRKPLTIDATLTADALAISARTAGVEVTRSLAGPFAVAKDAALMETAIRAAFERLGESRLALETLKWTNLDCRFVPVSKLNQMRRELLRELEAEIAAARDALVSGIIASAKPQAANFAHPGLRWSLKVDR